MVSVTGVVEPAPPSVTFVWPGSSYWTEFAMPVDAEVDSEATLLLVVLRPDDSELAVVDADVDSEATLLLVVLRPDDNELAAVDSELAVVDVDVDSEATLLSVVLRPDD
ncbi:hypothetical protein, partial [Paraburkholderia susongensis]